MRPAPDIPLPRKDTNTALVILATFVIASGAYALTAWILMLLLGALHSVTDWPVNHGGYPAAVIITIIVSLFLGGGKK